MPTDPTKHAAEMIRGLKGRIDKLEQASLSDRSGRSSDDLTVSPISKVVDRMNGGEKITITESTEPGSNVIDDFEDSDVTEYTGDTGAASFDSYPVQHGSVSLALVSQSDGSFNRILSTSGLPNYPVDGDTFRYWTYLPADTTGEFYFAAADLNNAYRIVVDELGSFSVAKLDGGSATVLDSDSWSGGTGWVEIEVVWDNGGGFTATLFDDGTQAAQVQTIDASYLSGGVGWGAGAAGALGAQVEPRFDFARVTSSSTVIDDFEDGNISEYSGGTSNASVINSAQGPVEHGTEALELTGTATIHAVQGNLNDDAVAGDTFESYHNLGAGGIGRFVFGLQDSSNYYFAEADSANGEVVVGKVDGGTESTLASTTGVTVPTGEWLRFEITWATDGTITAELFDAAGSSIAAPSGSSTTWSSGGHGWAEMASSVTSHGDYARVTTGGSQTAGEDVIDNFEDNDIDEYAGDTGTASVQTTTVQEGTYALDTDSAGTFIYSTSGSGLPNYPAQGDIFETRQYLGSSDVGQFAWGLQDASNYYYADTDPGAGTFQLRMVDGGTDSLLVEATGLTIPTGEWLRIEIEWQTDGTMIAKLFDSADTEITSGGIEATNDTWTSGGVGFGE